LDLAALRQRRLDTLSGGERQRVAIAAALAFRPGLLVLDEPTSQLDPKSAEDVLQALVRLNSDLGLTVLLAEHRLERVLPFVDRIVYLPINGSEVISGPPRQVLPKIDLNPPMITLAQALAWDPLPLTIKEGRYLSQQWQEGKIFPSGREATVPRSDEPYLQAHNVEVLYDNQPVVRGVNLKLWPGEIVALMGRNGAGKTTLMKSLVGLVRPKRGQITVAGQDVAKSDVAQICRYIGYLPQDPNSLLFADTVMDELLITLRNHGMQASDSSATLSPQELLERLGLADKVHHYPRDLSTGERQRVALGAIMVTQPGALLLDEPTRGLDYIAKQQLLDLLKSWRNESMAILLVTHDVELAAAAADRVLLMSQGEIIANGPPGEVLGSSPFFAPQIARLFPGTGWLTVDDVVGSLT